MGLKWSLDSDTLRYSPDILKPSSIVLELKTLYSVLERNWTHRGVFKFMFLIPIRRSNQRASWPIAASLSLGAGFSTVYK